MKKIALIGFSIVLIIVAVTAQQHTNFDKAWEEVKQFEKKAQPKSALSKINEIEKEAKQTDNRQQQIKAIIYRSQLQSQITEDALLQSIDEMQQFKSASTDEIEQAFLSSILAQMYGNYYNQNRYTISQRTKLQNYIPADMKEWSGNIFQDTIKALLKQSLVPARKLQATAATTYSDLLEIGKDSRTQRPTLFDLLSYQALSIWPEEEKPFMEESDLNQYKQFISLPEFSNEKLEIFRNLLIFHENDKQPDAFVMADLERLQYVVDNAVADNKDSLYLLRLDEIITAFSAYPVSVEAMEKKARRMMWERYQNCREKDFDATIPQQIYDLCQTGIRKFPNYPRIGILKNIIEEIQQKNIQASAPGIFRSNEPVKINLHYANVTNPTVTIWRYEMEPLAYEEASAKERDKFRKKVESRKLNLIPTNFYIQKDTVIEFTPKTFGIYGLSVEAPGMDQQLNEFRVTNMIHVIRDISGSTAKEIMIVDNESGKPLQNVSLKTYNETYTNGLKLSFLSEKKSDKDGKVTLTSGKKNRLSFTQANGDDRYAPLQQTYFYQNNTPETENIQYAIFSDRGIYRPGQTVHFKCIAYVSNKKQQKAVSGQDIKITLRNANYRQIAEQTLKTNEFGSAASSFILPENIKTGNFSMQAGNQSINIKVEEYKRPTFEINLEKPKETVSFGDEVKIGGEVKSLMGIVIPGATVKYRVIRQPNFLFRIGFTSEKQVSNGEIKSDQSGKFSFGFIPEKDKTCRQKQEYYTYRILVEATDMNGETQSNEIRINVGDRSMRLSMQMPERMLIDSITSLSVKAENLNGEPVQTTVNYSIYRLNDIEKLSEEKPNPNQLTVSEQVITGNTVANKESFASLKNKIADFKSGYYRFILEAKDDKGRTVTDTVHTVLYKSNEKMPPVKTHLWIETGKQELVYGETAEIRVGSSEHDTWIYYDVRHKNGVITSEWIKLGNEIKNIEIPFKEEYGQAIAIELFLVKNGKFYHQHIRFNKKQEKRELELQFTTFRDKLQPGEKETWTLKIPHGSAELLATLYDASLDQLYKNNWIFNPAYIETVYFAQWNLSWNRDVNLYLNSKLNMSKFNHFTYDQFMVPNFAYLQYSYGYAGGNLRSMKKESGVELEVVAESLAVADQALISEEESNTTSMQETLPNQPVRTNFAETAFFYPQLKTNDKGEVLLSFTMPESLTRWRFMGLAHTTDLYSGFIEKEIVTQKPFMVMPNLPRFLRQGDECVLTAKIINMSDAPQKGKARLDFADPVTEKIILTKIEDFNVNAGETKAVSWKFKVPENTDLLICRITANAGKNSDGEQKLLPVLSDKILLTESMPMTVRANETKTFTFDKFKNNKSKTLENKLLKLEFTASPAWYAVQALPDITVPETENAFSLIGAYYACTLAEHIARSHPKISGMIDIWKKQGGSKETLLSNLEKNKELKNILLEETPWVLEAKNETEQKQRLALLFDLNTQKANQSRMMEKLKELQKPDGSFCWFPAMWSSRYITLTVLNDMARLSQLGAIQYENEEKQMQIRALNYLDQELQKDYENLKKNSKDLKKAKINSLQLYYHAVRSNFRDIPIYGGTLDANKFYYGLIKNQWTEFGLYEKALAALTLYHNGDPQIAKQIINSLREHASTSNEMGMYWDKNRSGYFWNESAISTHVTMLEAFAEIDYNETEINELRIWLLKQKQTQRWESTPATVNAIYALLLRGEEWLSSDNKVTIQMGGKEIVPQDAEAGTGYFTQTFSGKEIRTDLGSVRVAKQGSGIAWGALYWQYTENLNQVEKAKTALHIEKKMMLEQVTAKGTELLPVDKNTTLKIGDKVIVRLVIRTDRDLEFVALKDQRAACLEPTTQLSGYQYREGLGYYQSPKDASMQYFFDRLPQGTYVMEYPLWITNAGEYTNGITTLQCLYAPEFVSHTESVKIRVSK